MTPEEHVRELIVEADETAGEIIRPLLQPLCSLDAKGNPEQVASAVVLVIGEHTLVITAGHVYRRFVENCPGIFIGTADGHLDQIDGRRVFTDLPDPEDDESDPLDVAVFRIEAGTADSLDKSACISLDKVLTRHEATPGFLYMFTGFPVAKSKQQLAKQNIQVTAVSYTGNPAENEAYGKIGLAKDNSILIKFQTKKCRSDETGNRSFFPKPHGVSGTGLWEIGKVVDFRLVGSDNPKLVGIVVEYRHDKGVAIATRIDFVLDMVRQEWPDLRSEIDSLV